MTTSKTHSLRWNRGNVKLPKRIIHLSLPSGHSCPAALECLAKADKDTGKITDGKEQTFRCYAAMAEARHTTIRRQRWHNFYQLRRLGRKSAHKKLYESLVYAHDEYVFDHMQNPIIRAHVGGDFFKEDYFLAWMDLANDFESTQFYAYTKRLDLWVMHMSTIPDNFMLNASRGGKFDDLIDIHKLKSAEVVLHPQQAIERNLQIDHDDSLAYNYDESFAQLIHGTQKAGTDARKAQLALSKETGWKGYSRDTKGLPEEYNTVLPPSDG